ncbi:MAG: hypothetical protein M3409_02935, partial [Gemmatimonadota bacterium]|nr:hypothetical protein [Gemmatimonadota bacterium]
MPTSTRRPLWVALLLPLVAACDRGATPDPQRSAAIRVAETEQCIAEDLLFRARENVAELERMAPAGDAGAQVPVIAQAGRAALQFATVY